MFRKNMKISYLQVWQLKLMKCRLWWQQEKGCWWTPSLLSSSLKKILILILYNLLVLICTDLFSFLPNMLAKFFTLIASLKTFWNDQYGWCPPSWLGLCIISSFDRILSNTPQYMKQLVSNWFLIDQSDTGLPNKGPQANNWWLKRFEFHILSLLC